MFEFAKTPTLEDLRQRQNEFVYDKMKWDKYQTPRNLFLAMIGELGELVTDVIGSDLGTTLLDDESVNIQSDGEEDGDKKEESDPEEYTKFEVVLDELVDVLSYLIDLSQTCRVDLAAPYSVRSSSRKKSEFSENSWEELEVAAFYNVSIDSKTTMLQDVFKLTFCTADMCDLIQFIDVEKHLSNLPFEAQEKVDRVLKKIFCHIIAIGSKFRFDLPRLLDAKNARSLAKYIDSVGVLSKEKVFADRYSDLPSFHLQNKSKGMENYRLDCKTTRDKDKYLSNLIEAIGLISEIFQWDAEGHEVSHSEPKHAHLAHQLAIIQHTVLQLAEHYKISLSEAFCKKMIKNNKKYPAKLVSGLAKKYNEYEEYNISEEKSDSNELDNAKSAPEKIGDASGIRLDLTIVDASNMMDKFVADRDWDQHHTPRNLTLDLFGEIGEVIELFIGKSTEPDIRCLSDELADCTSSTVRLAVTCRVDISAALHHYFPYNS